MTASTRTTSPLPRIALSVLVLAGASIATACDDPVGAWDPDPPSAFIAVSAGQDHTCAIAADRKLWCWGRMSIARLGYASAVDPCDGEVCVRPVPVYGDADATEVSAGGEHSCAIIQQSAYCWGYGYWGQLGDSRSVYQRCVTPHAADPLYCSIEPFPVALGLRIVDVTTGSQHSCVVVDSGAAYCFGLNQFRQASGAVPLDSLTAPSEVAGGHSFTAISAGTSHTCAIDTAGAAWCWGANEAGTLGDNQYYGLSDVPVAVTGDGITGGAPFTYRVIDSGFGHSCGVTTAGAAFCWGLGGGRLGRSDPFSWPFPVRVETPPGSVIADVSAGGNHTCVVTAIGLLYCFGENNFGQLGDGSAQTQFIPARVTLDASVAQVSAGARHTCAIDSARRLWCWGRNDWGQLGLGDLGDRTTPTRVGG